MKKSSDFSTVYHLVSHWSQKPNGWKSKLKQRMNLPDTTLIVYENVMIAFPFSSVNSLMTCLEKLVPKLSRRLSKLKRCQHLSTCLSVWSHHSLSCSHSHNLPWGLTRWRVFKRYRRRVLCARREQHLWIHGSHQRFWSGDISSEERPRRTGHTALSGDWARPLTRSTMLSLAKCGRQLLATRKPQSATFDGSNYVLKNSFILRASRIAWFWQVPKISTCESLLLRPHNEDLLTAIATGARIGSLCQTDTAPSAVTLSMNSKRVQRWTARGKNHLLLLMGLRGSIVLWVTLW